MKIESQNTLAPIHSLCRIRVNVISTGLISMPIFGKVGIDKGMLEQVAAGTLASVPHERFGISDEIARSVAFLVSDDAAFIADQEVIADGSASQV